MTGTAERLAPVLAELLGTELPVRLRGWDGVETGPPGAAVLVLANRRALRHLLWRPDELGLARAYVAGDLRVDPESDLYEVLAAVARLAERTDPAAPRVTLGSLFGARGRRLLGTALRLGAIGPRPPLPPEEARRLKGSRHSLGRDRTAISHHYDVGNDFYRLVLGPSMVYSCAYWTPRATTLELAQEAKLDLVCRKLGLRPGMRMLDVGCGWGSLLMHAARHYGVVGTGVTLSEEQARGARERIAEAGLTDQLTIRLQDYREISDGPYQAISSVGMAEHVGTEQYRRYAGLLYELLAPGGRLLNHQIARRPSAPGERYRTSPFITAYVFPDGDLAPIGATVSLLEQAGFEIRDVESLREHYGRTLRAWVDNLEAHWERANELTTPGRVRVWRLYMAASALAFEENRIGVNQVLAVRTAAAGDSGLPGTRAEWLTGADAPIPAVAAADGPPGDPDAQARELTGSPANGLGSSR
ncbi:cyclopropane-fatty-acyl-phospholipid synthase family protein [Streptacidiphilus sp. P02-A3a]|uniref:SAM-dependent methyltransferase n=1 Tax=Streptacidiphilus sp. P02-A3a TaxID=2704468 RepID=UPI0015FB9258|nr:cyclopropane-fatty-acyl-phospholipid synthase family protein [Streptacidiphilus sp. P02-A3a]QMU72895.1 class I SAM-dependent methyltransferase [Streptacidiphilus sp. P02-A3a]